MLSVTKGNFLVEHCSQLANRGLICCSLEICRWLHTYDSWDGLRCMIYGVFFFFFGAFVFVGLESDARGRKWWYGTLSCYILLSALIEIIKISIALYEHRLEGVEVICCANNVSTREPILSYSLNLSFQCTDFTLKQRVFLILCWVNSSILQ